MKLSVYFAAAFLTVFLFGRSAHADSAASEEVPRADPPFEKVTIAHWGQQRILLYLPLYVAMEEGLFAKRHIEAVLKYSGNDDQVFASVASGDAQFGIGDPIFAAIAHERGFAGKVVAMLVVKIGLSGYTTRPGLKPISSLDDLDGLRVGSFPSPSTTFTLLKKIQGDLERSHKQFAIVQLGIGAQAAGLGAGSIDIATDLEPAVSLAESKGASVVFSLDRFTDELAITGLTTTDQVVANRAETVSRVVEALEESLALLAKSPDVGVRVAQKLFPEISPPVVRTAVMRMLKLGVYPDSTRVAPHLWSRSAELRINAGDLPKSANIGAVVDNRFADAARSAISSRAPL